MTSLSDAITASGNETYKTAKEMHTAILSKARLEEAITELSKGGMISSGPRVRRAVAEKYKRMEEALQKIIDSPMAPSYACKDGPPVEATHWSKEIAEAAINTAYSLLPQAGQ